MSEQATPPSGPAQESVTALGALNAKTRARQRMLLLGGGGSAAMLALWFVFGGTGDHTPAADAPQKIETDGIVNRDLSQKEFVAIYGNRLDAQARQLKALEESKAVAPEVQARLDALAAENQALKTDGTKTIDALTQENSTLRSELTRAQTQPAPPPPIAARDPSIPSGSPLDPNMAAAQGATLPPPAERQVKTVSFTSGTSEAGSTAKTGLRAGRPSAPAIEIENSPEYLPPNSYAPARVIVGVDASAGVSSQTDPLPVVLRITGPARSVVKDGKLLTTRIQGCVVNGAARGDLSAEKVYVKLQKMTCDQPGGRVAVSEVKGFISFAGKTGVRGRVVSREGSLVSQALLAGIVGGFGRGFSANSNSLFSGITTGVDGKRQQLSGGDIVQGGLGQGVADASDTVSKYLIERAEQYQPVVEMPTGIDVEIVFLDGVYVRNSQ
ncbi:TrbI/VirB10 family protein [Sphingomonas jatrophae]|uniref:Conjugal transfer pilus assembly protein TraB n=1 Tax=Sphingomonas jatrophae TaxID=1166337 RepID=A0A1I6L988_9SPHN|nr:TrbI/VirB10 family protein [Sphingomonas jatrophae]SFR99808.1 conjugal transfer pilus assembly protein TraB [Sphingomonas jatrophae]